MSVVGMVIAAAPSRAPFYALGGALVVWAVGLSLVGMRQPSFPGSERRMRAVIAVSITLFLGAILSAILTS